MKLNIELKPCPICGGKPEIKGKKINVYATIDKYVKKSQRTGTYRHYCVRCPKCHIKTRLLAEVEYAVNAWNENMIIEL